jgi:signal transduction histidine kinase
MEREINTDIDVQLIGRLDAVPVILEVFSRITGMRFTAIARVTDSEWIACAVYDRINFGLKPGGKLVLESTICNEIRQHHQPVIFGHASKHPHFSTHATPRLYGLESYVSIPIFFSDGSFFGTLCAIDPEPARLDDPTLLATLQLFTKLIASQYEAELKRMHAETALLSAQETARLREQFVAVLSHDLRNPVHSISIGADFLELKLPEGPERRMAEHMQRSCKRVIDLIDSTLDFAHGRLGGGISLTIDNGDTLLAEVRHVISEIQRAHPQRSIQLSTTLPQRVVGDAKRISQLLGNLLSNAINYGEPGTPVLVSLVSDAAGFELTVENQGTPIDQGKIERLFQPFTRGTSSLPAQGLGLGLYIASEIAKAHGGAMSATSDASRTCFAFRMPLDSAAAAQAR